MNSQRFSFLRQARNFRPRLERLERRDCPSCTVFQREETLVILGDLEANHITIADTREGGIAVSCDRGEPQAYAGVNRIDLRTGDGDDEVTAVFGNPPDNFEFRADLGAGNDKLSISGFDPQPDPPLRSVSFDIHAGAGDDEVLFDLGEAEINGRFLVSADGGAGNDRLSFGAPIPCVLPESELRIGLFGGAGDDLIEMSLGGLENAGQFVLEAAGGRGNDRLVLGALDPCWLPESETRIALLGNAGDDLIEIAMSELEIEGQFDLSVLGGAGNDILDSFIQPCFLPAGRASFLFDGAAGNDRIAARFEADADSQGALDVRVFGGLGDDDLTLALNGVDDLALLIALVDGGRGHDIARVTRNVRVANSEEVIFLDEPR